MLVGVIIAKLLVLSEIVLGDNIKMKKFLLVIDLDGSNIPSNSKLLLYCFWLVLEADNHSFNVFYTHLRVDPPFILVFLLVTILRVKHVSIYKMIFL